MASGVSGLGEEIRRKLAVENPCEESPLLSSSDSSTAGSIRKNLGRRKSF